MEEEEAHNMREGYFQKYGMRILFGSVFGIMILGNIFVQKFVLQQPQERGSILIVLVILVALVTICAGLMGNKAQNLRKRFTCQLVVSLFLEAVVVVFVYAIATRFITHSNGHLLVRHFVAGIFVVLFWLSECMATEETFHAMLQEKTRGEIQTE